MKLVCISASNTRLAKGNSTSITVCTMIKDLLAASGDTQVAVDILPLREFDLKPCILCGHCYRNGLCIYDEEFNRLWEAVKDAQGMIFVVPHYSPIPSKLLILFEKINELTYAGWINDPAYRSPLQDMPVGIIGHGGMVDQEETLGYYHDRLITPVADTLKSLGLRVISPNDKFPNGIAFGLKDDGCLKKTDSSIFPEIIQDWSMIEGRIRPLVEAVRRSME